jgi:hypothetical protein
MASCSKCGRKIKSQYKLCFNCLQTIKNQDKINAAAEKRVSEIGERLCNKCGQPTLNNQHPLCNKCWRDENIRKYCSVKSCNNSATKEYQGKLLCEAHYDKAIFVQKIPQPVKSIGKGIGWFFHRGPDYQFFVPGVGRVHRKQTNLEAIINNIALIVGLIVIPLLLLLALIFQW